MKYTDHIKTRSKICLKSCKLKPVKAGSAINIPKKLSYRLKEISSVFKKNIIIIDF